MQPIIQCPPPSFTDAHTHTHTHTHTHPISLGGKGSLLRAFFWLIGCSLNISHTYLPSSLQNHLFTHWPQTPSPSLLALWAESLVSVSTSKIPHSCSKSFCLWNFSSPWGRGAAPLGRSPLSPPSPTETHYFARISSQRTLARISAHLHLIKIPIKIPLFSASSFLNTPKHHSDFCRVCCKKIPLVIFSQFVPIFGPLRQPPRLLVDKLFVLHEQLYILYLNSSAVNIP